MQEKKGISICFENPPQMFCWLTNPAKPHQQGELSNYTLSTSNVALSALIFHPGSTFHNIMRINILMNIYKKQNINKKDNHCCFFSLSFCSFFFQKHGIY